MSQRAATPTSVQGQPVRMSIAASTAAVVSVHAFGRGFRRKAFAEGV